MTRLRYAASYLAFLVRHVLAGSLRLAASLFTPGLSTAPAIVGVPVRCRTDVEITALTSSITITPGTLVLGIAAASGDRPATVFVHSLFATDRDAVVADVRDLEHRLLLALRGPADESRRPSAGQGPGS